MLIDILAVVAYFVIGTALAGLSKRILVQRPYRSVANEVDEAFISVGLVFVWPVILAVTGVVAPFVILYHVIVGDA